MLNLNTAWCIWKYHGLLTLEIMLVASKQPGLGNPIMWVQDYMARAKVAENAWIETGRGAGHV